MRATRYTPAVTIVAAWISADTGVGPAIASGNHTCSGICADLPVAPMNSRMPTRLAGTTAAAPMPNAALMLVHVQRAEGLVQHEHAEQETRVADAVGDEGLLAGARIGQVVEPEADQQVRGQADAFPADEQHQHRAAEHQQQHEEQEQVQVGEEAAEALVVRHVADRVDVDHRADAGDDQRHHRTQAVEVEGDLEREAADQRPAVGRLDERHVAAGLEIEQGLHGEQERQDRQAAADHGDEVLADAVAAELRGQHAVQHEAEQREQDDQREHGYPLRSL